MEVAAGSARSSQSGGSAVCPVSSCLSLYPVASIFIPFTSAFPTPCWSRELSRFERRPAEPWSERDGGCAHRSLLSRVHPSTYSRASYLLARLAGDGSGLTSVLRVAACCCRLRLPQGQKLASAQVAIRLHHPACSSASMACIIYGIIPFLVPSAC